MLGEKNDESTDFRLCDRSSIDDFTDFMICSIVSVTIKQSSLNVRLRINAILDDASHILGEMRFISFENSWR